MSETRADAPPPDDPVRPRGPDGRDDAEPSFAGFEPAPSEPDPAASYRVLARKYRPQSFADLIGQDAMVRTVRNAFLGNRIPQAWMLTGVRGVGKTTTARILARALNYDTGAGAGPSIEMPQLGIHCRAIMESRHVDVLEIDAASHTGVENIRQITDAVRYAPVQARYKVYIIDEVHMLSSAAFNAFLKTLEEPPPHAKFVFATTEIRKVPVTILSRCQRFDLRRVETEVLVAHLAGICAREGVASDPEALALIARAAEGSVRDALSLLDQAVAHGAGAVAAAGVRDMLGLADRGQVVDLFEAAMRGDVPAAFAVLRSTFSAGADPRQTLEDLAAFAHLVTRLKLVPEASRDLALTEVERVRGADFAVRLSVRALSRAWQVLTKAIPEVAASQRPLAAAEMALVRLAYAADLPTPDDILRRLRDAPAPADAGPAALPPSSPRGPAATRGSALAVAHPDPAERADVLPAASAAAPRPGAAAEARPLVLRRFEDVVALAGERREIGLKVQLERDVRPVRFEDGHVEIALTPSASRTLPNELSRALGLWTDRRWVVSVSSGETAVPTLAEERQGREAARRRGAEEHPLVQAVLETFPGAQIVNVIDKNAAEAAAPAAGPEPPPDDPDDPGPGDDDRPAG